MLNTSSLRPVTICFLSIVMAATQRGPLHAQTNKSYSHHQLLIRDEGISQLAYVNLDDSTKNWYTPIPVGRDVQLVGQGQVLVGTGNGFEEHDLVTGTKTKEITAFPGTVAARRLRNGNTLLCGVNLQGKQGIVLLETDGEGQVKNTIVVPGYDYVRLVRETANGNLLVTANNVLFETDRQGNVVWKAVIGDGAKTHAWQALRLKNGQTVVSTGYNKNLQFFSKDGKLLDSLTSPVETNPNFFAGFQIMPNGNYLITNWQGHGPNNGAKGIQAVELSPSGKLAWQWKQDASHFSSLHCVLVLDGLDPKKLYTEDADGKLSRQ